MSNNMEDVLRSMDLEFFGTGQHKMTFEKLCSEPDAVLLDVRSVPERESVEFHLKCHLQVLQIPTNEIPDRINEIPRDKMVGIFCSAGTRAAIVYAYLRSQGYDKVRVIPGGYDSITSAVIPGKLWKLLQNRK